MASAGCSLRMMVEQWLSPDPVAGFRVTEFRNRRTTQECYVCVETSRAKGPIALFFFHHPDGTWSVFPPRLARPAMRSVQQ